MVNNENIQLFMSLFKGRGDIYAKHWEKNGKSGYGPAYKLDWQEFNAFKAKGGKFVDFQNKTPLPLTWEVVKGHLEGIYIVGIYPLLQDNTSHFIVADFDGENWQQECQKFISVCKQNNISAYLERSRSGKGGHVWIFFEEAYPAYKSRKIVLELIRQALNLSQFDKEVSFDRLFPNQDYHSNLGIGNLIALPLQAGSLQNGNSVFLDTETLEIVSDQWGHLCLIQKLSIEKLDKLFEQISNGVKSPSIHTKETGKLSIVIRNQIYLKKDKLTPELVNFLRENLNFSNTDKI